MRAKVARKIRRASGASVRRAKRLWPKLKHTHSIKEIADLAAEQRAQDHE